MTSLPRVTIGLQAAPNVPTDGYMFIRHSTQPDDGMRQAAWWIACQLVERMSDILPTVLSIDCTFSQRPTPGELGLNVAITIEPITDTQLSVDKMYSGISLPHMQDHASMKRFLVDPLMEDLRRELARARSDRNDQNEKLTGLLHILGEPHYADLY